MFSYRKVSRHLLALIRAKIFIEFIAEGRDPNIRDQAKNTPLHWAAGAGHSEAIAYLLSLPNIDLTAQNLLGDTALHRVSDSIQNLDELHISRKPSHDLTSLTFYL